MAITLNPFSVKVGHTQNQKQGKKKKTKPTSYPFRDAKQPFWTSF